MIKKRIKLFFYSIIQRYFKTEIRETKNTEILNKWADIFEDDVFLVSYPRSGNTWLRYLLTNLRFPNADWDMKSLYYSFPEVGGDIDISGVPRPRWIKSHFQYNPKYKKVIYLYRDGRDVAASFYNWSGKNKTETFDTFLKNYFLKDGNDHYWGSWQDHINSWWNKERVLYVKYEDLLERTAITLKEIADFINLDVSENEIAIAIEKSTFEKQQKDFDKFFSGQKVGIKGKAGAGNDYFDKSLLKYFIKETSDILHKLGYKHEL